MLWFEHRQTRFKAKPDPGKDVAENGGGGWRHGGEKLGGHNSKGRKVKLENGTREEKG